MEPGHRTDKQLQLLSDPRNRAIRDTLIGADSPLHVEELAHRLVEQEIFVVSSATYEKKLDKVIFELHHDRLPRLSEAELVEYDRDANLVSEKPFPESEVRWHDDANVEQLLTHLDSSSKAETGDIGVLEGFDSVIRYGRKLVDEADKELFTLYATTDLLEEECVQCGERALARGVSLHIGSRNPAVRQLTREHLPDATVWEPQLDWLNTPNYPRVGRLVLADRRKVIFSLLTEPPTEDSAPEEIGLVGEGKDSPLVVLVRGLLGARLDHLDYQSEDFRSELTHYHD